MTTRSTLLIKQPRENIRGVLVARTWALAGFIDEIEHAELVGEIESNDDVCTAKHRWQAVSNVPDLLMPHIDADTFSWIATVKWREGEFTSQWLIEPLSIKEDITCSALLSLDDSMGGQATRIRINLNIKGLENHQGVEAIAKRIVLVNWQKLVEATTQYLEKID